MHHDFRADDAGSAGAIINHNLLSQLSRESLRIRARYKVSAAAGALRNDETNRPRRIGSH